MFSKTVAEKARRSSEASASSATRCRSKETNAFEMDEPGSAETGCFDNVSIKMPALKIRPVQLPVAQGRSTQLDQTFQQGARVTRPDK